MELMTLTVPKNVEELQMLNVDSIIPVYVNILKKEKCNLIVLLSHNGEDNDKEFAEKFHNDIDIIIGGHSHTPIFKPEIVEGTIICQAGSYGRWLGKLDVKVDIKKDTVIKCYGKLYETIFDSAIYDKHAQIEVESMLAEIEPEMKKPIGTTLSDLNKSSLGQWEADAIREKLQTDISFLNAGSIRKNLIKGNITIGDVWEINPFGNTMMKFSVSGKTLKNMMANSIRISNKSKENADYDNVIISGIYVEFHSKSISDETDDFITKILINGKELNINSNYSISTNNYMVSQLKKYFGEIPEEIKAEDTNILDRDLIIETVQKQKEINPVFEKRIVDKDKE
jgi:2',3'-cyclic-nucleotide 2'-phosphodiesterase (5'-nucleotidase family)